VTIFFELHDNGWDAFPGQPNARWSEPREFRNLRWEGGTYPRTKQTPDGIKILSEEEYKKQFQKSIDDSIELEQRDEVRP